MSFPRLCKVLDQGFWSKLLTRHCDLILFPCLFDDFWTLAVNKIQSTPNMIYVGQSDSCIDSINGKSIGHSGLKADGAQCINSVDMILNLKRLIHG